MLDPIITSYFYLQGATTTDKTIDFIHKSFGEYLLAEYYLESMLQDKKYYLCVGTPTQETLMFLDGLLELLICKKEELVDYVNILIKSLVLQSEKGSKTDIVTTIAKRARLYYEDEEIIVLTTGRSYQDGKWNVTKLPVSKFPLLWVHRWISLFLLKKLDPKVTLDNKVLAELIITTSHTAPTLAKKMAHADLSGADLSYANLSGADLSYANLSGADLSYANLSGADLSYANLSGADLSGARLKYADLSNADLSNADLSNADLSNADLNRANLHRANLSNATLYAYLFYATLANANLSNANLYGAGLYRANLSDANLSNANLSGANLVDIKISDKTILPDSYRLTKTENTSKIDSS